jgi:fluoroacetyl-CoA thioesterase
MQEPHRSHTRAAAEARSFPPQDDFPAVHANSKIIELMELAAAHAMRTHLSPGESSRGIEMNVRYHAAAMRDAELRVYASHAGVSGRVHRFVVQVSDEFGLVARGEHARAVVLPRRLLAQARRRAGLPAMLLAV